MANENSQILGQILERLDKIQEQQNLHQISLEYLKSNLEEQWRIPNIHEKVLILQDQLKNIEKNILAKVSQHCDQSGTVTTSPLTVQTTDQHYSTELQVKETSHDTEKNNAETSDFTDPVDEKLAQLSKVITEGLQEISSVANILVSKMDSFDQKQADMMKEMVSHITDHVTRDITSSKDELVKIVKESSVKTMKKLRTCVTKLTQSTTSNHEKVGQQIQQIDTSLRQIKETSESLVKSNELGLITHGLERLESSHSKCSDHIKRVYSEVENEITQGLHKISVVIEKQIILSKNDLKMTLVSSAEKLSALIEHKLSKRESADNDLNQVLKLVSLSSEYSKQTIENIEKIQDFTLPRIEEHLIGLKVKCSQTLGTVTMASNEVLTSRREGQEKLEKCVTELWDSFSHAQTPLEDKVLLLSTETETKLAGINDELKSSTKKITDNVSEKLEMGINEMKLELPSTLDRIKENKVTLQQIKDCQQKSETTVIKVIKEVAEKVVDVKDNINAVSERKLDLIKNTTTLQQMKDCRKQSVATVTKAINVVDAKDKIFKRKTNLFKKLRTPSDDLSSFNEYTCDFFVENFRDLVKSGYRVHSDPWIIQQYKICVKGGVYVASDGTMHVYLVPSPRKYGLPQRPVANLLVTASITDLSGTLPNRKLGQTKWSWNWIINNNDNDGVFIGTVNCQELLDKGYAQKEGYVMGAILIRYVIKELYNL